MKLSITATLSDGFGHCRIEKLGPERPEKVFVIIYLGAVELAIDRVSEADNVSLAIQEALEVVEILLLDRLKIFVFQR